MQHIISFSSVELINIDLSFEFDKKFLKDFDAHIAFLTNGFCNRRKIAIKFIRNRRGIILLLTKIYECNLDLVFINEVSYLPTFSYIFRIVLKKQRKVFLLCLL